MSELIEDLRFPFKQFLGFLQSVTALNLGGEFFQHAQLVKAISILRQIGASEPAVTEFADDEIMISENLTGGN